MAGCRHVLNVAVLNVCTKNRLAHTICTSALLTHHDLHIAFFTPVHAAMRTLAHKHAQVLTQNHAHACTQTWRCTQKHQKLDCFALQPCSRHTYETLKAVKLEVAQHKQRAAIARCLQAHAHAQHTCTCNHKMRCKHEQKLQCT